MRNKIKRDITEEAIIFISVLKWVILALIIGLIVGLATTVFLFFLNWSINFTHQFSYYYFILPVAIFIVIIVTKYIAPDAEGHGTEKVIEAVHKYSGKIKPIVVPVKIFTTILTLAAGGSVGKEGPCAQIGSGLASIFADIAKFDDHDRKKIVICGISAGFAAVFGTPIAGAIFGVEVLFAGSILYEVLLPSFISGIISFQISNALGTTYLNHHINFIPQFSQTVFIEIIFAGIFFGLCSFLFIQILSLGKKLAEDIKIWYPLKGIIGGLILIIFALIFSTKYLGLGLDTIENSLDGGREVFYVSIVKAVSTSISLNFGGSGGIVTPIFFVGSTAGNLFAQIFNLDIATFSALGLVSLLAGAANTPIAASIMGVELFGPIIGPYAVITCVISFLMTGHRSVYPSQILSIRKSVSLKVELGKEIEDTLTKFEVREKSVIGRTKKLYHIILDLFFKKV